MLTHKSALPPFCSSLVMEAERPSIDGLDGSGSWHPALRPDSYNARSGEGAQYVPDEGHVEQDAISEPLASPAKPKIVPKLPLNFAGGHGEGAEEPKTEGLQLDSHTGTETHEPGQESHSQELETGDSTQMGVPSQAANPVAFNVRPHDAWVMDLSRGADSASHGLDSWEEHQVYSNDEGFKEALNEPVSGTREGNGIPPEQTVALEAKKEMDNAFKSESQHEEMGHASINRTYAFPEIPLLHNSTNLPAHSLPKSQAEDIMEEDEAYDQRRTVSTGEAAQNGTLDSANDNDEDQDFFANLNSLPAERLSLPAADEEIRYEEGLPLVPSEHLQEGDLPLHTRADIFFPNKSQPDPADDDAGFLETPAPLAEDLSTRPHELDRKTTSQVLDAMHYGPQNVAQLVPESREMGWPKDIHAERPSLADLTGGGIAVSTHTVQSQVLSEEHIQSTGSESKEDDLAEMWKAALGDDDLLNENETSLDPSALFGDDDGFLDDLAGHSEDLSKAPLSPPLEAVYSSDGKMEGFGKSEQRPKSRSNKYIPDGTAAQPQRSNSSYERSRHSGISNTELPPASSFVRNSVSTPAGFGGAGVTAQQTYGALAPQRPQMQASTQSFADKSKEGYTSPYDLPMDVTRPRKRNHLFQNAAPNQATPSSHIPPPPPRSSSMFTGVLPPSQPHPSSPSSNRPGAAHVAASATPPTLRASPIKDHISHQWLLA